MTALSDPALDLARIRAALDALLPAWLPGRRWYAGKGAGSPPDVTTRLLDVVLPGDPALLVAVFDAGADGPYQALLGVRRDPVPPSAEPLIGRLESPDGSGVFLYEATQDPELMGALLARIAAGGRTGPLCFEPAPGVELPVGTPGVASTAEQSNTSVAFAERAMLKVLRRPVPGDNPELELLTALRRAGGVPSAALLAQVRTSASSAVGARTLALLQQFVRSRGDGWTIAVDRARACMAGSARRSSRTAGSPRRRTPWGWPPPGCTPRSPSSSAPARSPARRARTCWTCWPTAWPRGCGRCHNWRRTHGRCGPCRTT
ncbi:hypothetical protein O1M54_26325 [Streptomyces diastatochromogenes]|nr:hypothetical protein [Streptomyces diastatochromogenes]